MGKIKKLIQEATSPKKVESLLSICLLRMAEFLNTNSVHAAIDHSGYWINAKFYTNEDMVQEFINNFGDKKSTPEKEKTVNITPKPALGMNVKAMKSAGLLKKGKRGRPKK
jgi:hypothetical protein